MAHARRRFDLGARAYGAASAIGITAGLALIAATDPTLTALGVIGVILGAVGLLFAVAAYLGE